jgi:hypothetical protein
MKYVDFGDVIFNPKDVSYIVIDIRTIKIHFKKNSYTVQRTYDSVAEARGVYGKLKLALC